MQTRQESEFIYKVTTTSQNAADLFNYYSQFFSHAYSLIGCTMYVEAINGGAVVFYHTLKDFLKIHDFVARLGPGNRVPPPPPDAKAKILRLVIEFVKKPENISIHQLAQILKETHQIHSPDISVKIKSPSIVVIRYKSSSTFDMTIKKIWDTLGKKVTQTTPPLK